MLVTTPHWQSALACVQSLGRLGHEVYLVGGSPQAAVARSRFCHGIVPSPPEPDGEAYIESLIRALRRERFDLLVPISDDVVELISRRRDEVAALTRLALAPPEWVAIGGDKARMTRFAMGQGIPVPDSFFPEDMEQARALAREIDYPCVAKLPRGTGSDGVQVVGTAEELLAFFEERGAPGNWPFVQRFLPGDFYDATAVCEHGRVVAFFAFRAPIRYHMGGNLPYSYSLRDDGLAETTRRIAEAMDWHGCMDLDFLMGPDGRCRLLELNPRLSGTTNFAYKLGVDLPRAYLDVAFGRPAGDYGSASYPDGVLFRSVVPTELWWWNTNRRARLPAVLLKTLNPRVRTNFYWTDPPLLRAQLRDMRHLLALRPLP